MLCVFFLCRMIRVIFTNLIRSFSLTHTLILPANIFFPPLLFFPFVSSFWSSVTYVFFFFSFFSQLMLYSLALLSIGKRDIFIRFQNSFAHTYSHSSTTEERKAHLDVAFLTNQSDIQSVRICKCMSSKSSHRI